MGSVRITLKIEAELLARAQDDHPGWTNTALVEEGLRALVAKEAAMRLAALGGSAKRAKAPRRTLGPQ